MANLNHIVCTACREHADGSAICHLSADELAPLVVAAEGLAVLAQAKALLPSLELLVLGEEVDLQFFARHQGHPLAVLNDEDFGRS